MGNAEITVTDYTASKTVIVIYFSKTGVDRCIVSCKMCLIFSFFGVLSLCHGAPVPRYTELINSVREKR